MAKKKVPKRDFTVGYGRPPVHTRFKPGQSGNPKGRPRGSINLQTLLMKLALKKAAITENGRPRKISKLEVAYTQMVNKAAAGDIKSLLALVKLLEPRAPKTKKEIDQEEQQRMVAKKLTELSDEEMETLKKLLEKLGLREPT
jgi:uncharacterized protein DUF5681